jgi:hypothetical protein
MLLCRAYCSANPPKLGPVTVADWLLSSTRQFHRPDVAERGVLSRLAIAARCVSVHLAIRLEGRRVTASDSKVHTGELRKKARACGRGRQVVRKAEDRRAPTAPTRTDADRAPMRRRHLVNGTTICPQPPLAYSTPFSSNHLLSINRIAASGKDALHHRRAPSDLFAPIASKTFASVLACLY